MHARLSVRCYCPQCVRKKVVYRQAWCYGCGVCRSSMQSRTQSNLLIVLRFRQLQHSGKEKLAGRLKKVSCRNPRCAGNSHDVSGPTRRPCPRISLWIRFLSKRPSSCSIALRYLRWNTSCKEGKACVFLFDMLRVRGKFSHIAQRLWRIAGSCLYLHVCISLSLRPDPYRFPAQLMLLLFNSAWFS